MGEAKIRKASDSSYGKVPKERPMRGLIISNPIHISHDLVSLNGTLDSSELRFSLLYWDKLVHPRSNFISFGGSDDEQFLVSAGILNQPTYTHSGGGMEEVIFDTYNLNP